MNEKKFAEIAACFIAILFCITLTGCSGLKIRKVVVPHHRKKGQPVVLECNYDLEDDQLYSVKWYKGIREFFRYVPADAPPIQIFEVPGIHVDLLHSTDRRVTLKEVTLKSSGKYKCEVSAEAPSFHTDSGAGELLVVQMPETIPNISGVRSRYNVGDLVHVNCSSSRSKPAASLTWYINEKQAESRYLVDYAPVADPDGLETSTLGLRFRARIHHLNNGELQLRCSATIAAIYNQQSRTSARGFPNHPGGAKESTSKLSRGSNGGRKSSPAKVAIVFSVIAALLAR